VTGVENEPAAAPSAVLGHRIHGYPAVEEYVDTGHVEIVSNWLYQLIPNDGRRGLGLRASVDAWLAMPTNNPSSDSTMPDGSAIGAIGAPPNGASQRTASCRGQMELTLRKSQGGQQVEGREDKQVG
jgi:hypothetical protein